MQVITHQYESEKSTQTHDIEPRTLVSQGHQSTEKPIINSIIPIFRAVTVCRVLIWRALQKYKPAVVVYLGKILVLCYFFGPHAYVGILQNKML